MPRPRSKISVTPADPDAPRHEGTLFLEGVPTTTKAAFKAACAKRQHSMRDVMITFMRRFSARMGTASAVEGDDPLLEQETGAIAARIARRDNKKK